MDKSQKHYVEQKKLDTKGCILWRADKSDYGSRIQNSGCPRVREEMD